MYRKATTVFGKACVFLFFLLFFIFPIAYVLRGGISDSEGNPTFIYLAEVFCNPLYREGLLNSFCVAVCTTAGSMVLAVSLAWLADRYDFPGKKLLTGALLLPMILPPFVGALGMQRILGRYGAVNVLLGRLGLTAGLSQIDWLGCGGFWGIVLLEVLHLYPILYLNAAAAFANVDPLLREAAEDLGCTGFRQFRKITLPLVTPGLFAGGAIVFIWSFTELGTPLMFHFDRITPVQIFSGIKELGSNSVPYALVIVMMSFAAGIYLLAKATVGRHGYAMTSKAGVADSRIRLGGLAGTAVAAVFSMCVFIGILPHLGVLGIAFGETWYRTVLPGAFTLGHFEAGLAHDLTVPSILNSVRYAGFAVIVAIALGIFIAHAVVREGGRSGWLLDTLSMLPLAVPGLVLAFGYLAMSRKDCMFHFLDPIENPTALLVIAYAVRRLPYVVRAAVAGLQQTSKTLEEASADLGGSPLRTFRRIIAPLIAANLIAGGILAFSFSMLEVSDSLLLAQRAVFFPITKAIYELSMLLGKGQALSAALGVWTMLFLGTSLLVASRLLGKRMGALFRV